MRGSADAVAVARDVASSSPSKPASALDMMRYANPPPIPFACGCRCTCSGERCVRRFLVFSYVRCVFPGIEAASLRSRFRRPCLLVRRSGSCRADLRSFSLSCRVRGPSLLCAARLLFEARFDLQATCSRVSQLESRQSVLFLVLRWSRFGSHILQVFVLNYPLGFLGRLFLCTDL
jgi:hypothetical protein